MEKFPEQANPIESSPGEQKKKKLSGWKKVVAVGAMGASLGAGAFTEQQKSSTPENDQAIHEIQPARATENKEISLADIRSYIVEHKDSTDVSDNLEAEHVIFYDFNGDGREDAAFIEATNGGGSGTFYKIKVLLQREGGLVESGEVFLGDRVTIKSFSLEGGEIIVKYDDPASYGAEVTRAFKMSGEKLWEDTAAQTSTE